MKEDNTTNRTIDFWDAHDCPYFEAYDDGDDYPPNLRCGKTGSWFDYTTICFKCRGQWSTEMIEDYLDAEWEN